MSRRFPRFEFRQVVIGKNCFRFLKAFSAQFQFLSFTGCRVDERCLRSLPCVKLDRCSNLKTLQIKNCSCWTLFSHIPNLKSLCIYPESGFCDKTFSEIDDLVPSIQHFTLMTNIVSDFKVYRRFYPNGALMYDNPSDALLSYPFVERFIQRRSSSLVSLNLSHTDLSDKAAVQLSAISNLKLRKVSLGYCLRCSRIFKSFCSNQRSLISINLSKILFLPDEELEKICALLPLLEEVTLTYCTKINKSVEKLFQLENLKSLDLRSCHGIMLASFSKAICGAKCRNLQKLDLCDTRIDASLITELLRMVRNLKDLNLSYCKVANENVVAISETLKSLRYLSLARCVGISDEGLTGPCSEMNFAPLSNIKGLVALDLSHCCNLSEESLTRVIRFPGLLSLNLIGIELSPTATEELFKNNPFLRSLKHGDFSRTFY